MSFELRVDLSQLLLAAIEGVAVNKGLTGLPYSTNAIAAWAVYNQMLMLAMMPAAATSVAVVPYVALLLPRGELARIRRELRATLVLILVASGAITVLMGWVFAQPLASFFVDRGSSGNGIDSLAIDTLRLLPLGALAAAPFFVPSSIGSTATSAGLRDENAGAVTKLAST